MRLKFKKGDIVCYKDSDDYFHIGQIQVYDVYTKKYLVFFGLHDMGDEWCSSKELNLFVEERNNEN